MRLPRGGHKAYQKNTIQSHHLYPFIEVNTKHDQRSRNKGRMIHAYQVTLAYEASNDWTENGTQETGIREYWQNEHICIPFSTASKDAS